MTSFVKGFKQGFEGVVQKIASVQNHERLVDIARHVDGLLSDEVKTRIVISTNDRPATQGREEAMLLDPENEAHKFYGASAPCLYLIRPDGYIGFRCQPSWRNPCYSISAAFCAGKRP